MYNSVIGLQFLVIHNSKSICIICRPDDVCFKNREIDMLPSVNNFLDRIWKLNESTHVTIEKISLSECQGWHLNRHTGWIENDNNAFFSVAGIRHGLVEQPIIIQDEIGYLGILRKRIDGEMKYLMQYKIEPGNINCIQISPTIQATKSNFTQRHGGKKPAYLDYFLNSEKYKVIVDQIQSEQSSRFLGKRNRNIVVEVQEDEDVNVLPSHEWMTLAEIKALMRYDNLVNMDTRTVLSCIPYHLEGYVEEEFSDKTLFKSMYEGDHINHFPEVLRFINNYKMFSDNDRKIIKLEELRSWSFSEDETAFCSDRPYSFRVIFCDIEIEGREVRHWCQPLFEATGIATFGLFTCVKNGSRLFLVRAKPEIGCFDQIELGPTIQREAVRVDEQTIVDLVFDQKLKKNEGVIFSTLLSEEGGRFFHEQNRNVLIEVDKDEVELPPGYFWLDYKTLSGMIQFNNVCNIQLRNLLSVLEF